MQTLLSHRFQLSPPPLLARSRSWIRIPSPRRMTALWPTLTMLNPVQSSRPRSRSCCSLGTLSSHGGNFATPPASAFREALWPSNVLDAPSLPPETLLAPPPEPSSRSRSSGLGTRAKCPRVTSLSAQRQDYLRGFHPRGSQTLTSLSSMRAWVGGRTGGSNVEGTATCSSLGPVLNAPEC